MAVRRLLGVLMALALLGGSGCCSWCERWCSHPNNTCCTPTTAAAPAYVQPAPVVRNGCTCSCP
jgi:hypothetical protein